MPDLESHTGPSHHTLDHLHILGEELVDFEELAGGLLVEPEHLHGADFEARSEDCVDDLPQVPVFYDVRFYYAERAVVQDG